MDFKPGRKGKALEEKPSDRKSDATQTPTTTKSPEPASKPCDVGSSAIKIGEREIPTKDLYSDDGLMDFHDFSEDTLKYLFDDILQENFESMSFRVIVGKGLHSADGSVIREKLIAMLNKSHKPVKIDPINEGRVIIGNGKSKCIPSVLVERYGRLKALLLLKGESVNYNELATDPKWRKTLIAYGKIPNDTDDQIAALKAVINACATKVKKEKSEMKSKTVYEAAANEEQGREAMLVHISISLIGIGNDRQYDMAIALMDAITRESFKSLKSPEERKEYLMQVVKAGSFGRKVLEKFKFKCKDEEKAIVTDVLSTVRGGYEIRDRGAARGGFSTRGRGTFRATFCEERKVDSYRDVDESGRGCGGSSKRGRDRKY